MVYHAGIAQKTGGILRIAIVSQGGNIGWPVGLTAGGAFAQSYYETLLQQIEKGELQDWLASDYKVATDHLSMTFTIRSGIKFTDGSDLTPDVVKWNLDQQIVSQPNWKSVAVTGPNTVQVNFKKWDNSIPSSFADSQPGVYMVSKAAYDKYGETYLRTHPVGTGPFTLTAYTMNGSAQLAKNPNYWRKDANNTQLPYLDGLAYNFTADYATELNMAKAGSVDMIINTFSGKQMNDYAQAGWTPRMLQDANEVWVPDSADKTSPWSKLEVREAAEYAIDRPTIAKQFGYGYLTPPNQIPPGATTAYQASYPLARNYDPVKAKELLKQAGYPNGFTTKLTVWQGGDQSIALVEQAYLKAVGINAVLSFADIGKWASYIGPTGKYSGILEGPDPASGPSGLGCITFAMFLYGKNWEQPPALLQAIAAATSADTPTPALVQAASDILTKDALMIPLYGVGSGRVDAKYVHADFGTRGLPLFNLESAWMSSK
jgi:ABC-type transport system substrate-binding protein